MSGPFYPPPEVMARRAGRLRHVARMLADLQSELHEFPADHSPRFYVAEASRAIGDALERMRQDDAKRAETMRAAEAWDQALGLRPRQGSQRRPGAR